MAPRRLVDLVAVASLALALACGPDGSSGAAPDASATAADGGDDAPDAARRPDASPDEPDAGSPPLGASLWCFGDGVENERVQLAHFALSGGAASFDFALPGGTGGELYAGDADAGLGSYGAYAVSPDGARVALAADLEVVGRFDLYVVSAAGDAPIQVVAMTANADVERVVWSPDGQRLAFRADLEVDGSSDAYVIGADAVAGTPARVTPARPGAVADASVLDADDILWSPTSAELVVTGDFTEDGYQEAWAVDLGAGGPSLTELIGRADIAATATGTKGAIVPLAIGGSGAVLLRTRADADNRFKLQVVDGDVRTTLANSELARPDDSIADIGAVGVSPDGQTIALSADDTVATAYEVWVMPIDGSASPTRITDGTAVAGRNPEFLRPLQWNPAGDHVVFLADYATNNKIEPYAVPVAGGGQIRLAAITGDAALDAHALTFAADGKLYLIAEHETDNDRELFQLGGLTADQTPLKILDVAVGGDFEGCAASLIAE